AGCFPISQRPCSGQRTLLAPPDVLALFTLACYIYVMTHRALQPIAEIIGNVPRRPELAEVEERLVQLRERLDTLCWDDSQAEAIWDEQSPERQRKSAGLRQRIRERRREAQAEIERQICRRAEARAQHVAKL